jgi:hypothetical protein
MSGQGRKTFVAGEVLLAQELNDYLMDQSVMNFATEAARGSAIPTPTEGMLALTLDTDEIDYYNGSAWVPALPIGAWTSYTPVLAGTGWSLGSTGAVASGSYVQIGKTVHFTARLTFGTVGATFGAANRPTVTLPVSASTSSTNTDFVTNIMYFDSSATLRYGGSCDFTSTTVDCFAWNAAGTYLVAAAVVASAPFTWAASDQIIISGTYEAA